MNCCLKTFGKMSGSNWIAVDWGTSNLRLWLIGQDNEVLESRQSDKGMGNLAPEEFEGALLELAGDLVGNAPMDVLICGMAGARQGWMEAPYAAVPCLPVGTGAIEVPTDHANLKVRILPGLCQAEPADVMRGEETQIAGFLAEMPDFKGVICLPGTHTKWVSIEAGLVAGFSTSMTGEFFAFLSNQSTLSHAMNEKWDDEVFAAEVCAAEDGQNTLLSALFSIRAGAMLDSSVPNTARSCLSGKLIGSELREMSHRWKGQKVVVVGDATLGSLYVKALGLWGCNAEFYEGGEFVRRGLAVARGKLGELL